MKAMVLAAGEGMRLRPLTHDRPKPMLPVAGLPLLEHTIYWLRGHGVRQVAINLHHKPALITQHFGDGSGFGVEINYSHEEQLLGTAGAVKRLERFFDRTFVVAYGDVFTDLDLTAMADFHRARRGAGTIALYHADNPTARGLVETAEDDGIVRFAEKPRPEEVFTDLANGGVYILEPEVLSFIPSESYYDFGHNLFPDLLRRGLALYGYAIPDSTCLIDIGSPESYQQAQSVFAAQRAQNGRRNHDYGRRWGLPMPAVVRFEP